MSKNKHRANRVFIANCILFVLLVAAFLYTTNTAVTWTKVDKPEHPETFRTVEQETGKWLVFMDDESPCYVGQDWTDCINAMIDEYNGACADKDVFDKGTYIWADGAGGVVGALKASGSGSGDLCRQYKAEIERMEALDAPGYYVVTLGDWGHLTSKKQVEEVEVSNNDYEPAVTHEAICYLGIIGECDMDSPYQIHNSTEMVFGGVALHKSDNYPGQ